MAKKHEDVIEAKIILFEELDKERDLRLTYPELAKIEEFSGLHKKEVRLCWLIGNRTSPIYTMNKADKIRRAMDMVYRKDEISRSADLTRLYELSEGEKSIPDKILSGIERMAWFDPDNRLKAKLITQLMFDTMAQMVVDGSSNLNMMDMDEKKKYMDLMVKANSEMPEMIKTLESGYGVKLVNRKTGGKLLVDINKIGI